MKNCYLPLRDTPANYLRGEDQLVDPSPDERLHVGELLVATGGLQHGEQHQPPVVVRCKVLQAPKLVVVVDPAAGQGDLEEVILLAAGDLEQGRLLA